MKTFFLCVGYSMKKYAELAQKPDGQFNGIKTLMNYEFQQDKTRQVFCFDYQYKNYHRNIC